MSVREFREEASAAAGEFQHGSIFGDTVSVSVVESLKESRLKGGVFVKNDVVVERGLVPVSPFFGSHSGKGAHSATGSRSLLSMSHSRKRSGHAPAAEVMSGR